MNSISVSSKLVGMFVENKMLSGKGFGTTTLLWFQVSFSVVGVILAGLEVS